MFLLNLRSLNRWLVMTEFEMLMNLIGLFIFSILLHLKFDQDYDSILTWRHLFIPLWIVDGLSLYFCIIVFLRQLGAFQTKEAALRLFISFLCLASRFVAKLMIYQMLNINNDLADIKRIKFQYASVPIFFHLVINFTFEFYL